MVVNGSDRPIVSWRFVAGVLLHFALPSYVVTVAAVLMASPQPLLLAPALRLTLLTSAWFVPGYGLLTVALAAAARYVDPLLRRRRAVRTAADPALAVSTSERRVADAAKAMMAIAASGDSTAQRIREAVSLLAEGAWHHDDRAFQRLSSDLSMAATAFGASFGAAGEDDKREVELLAAVSLERLAGELHRLNAERDRLEHGDARVAARYIEMRYGSVDFTGDRLE